MVGDNRKKPDGTLQTQRSSDEDFTNVNGDPGVGGLLANPLEAVSKADRENIPAGGTPSPDPEPPEAHGDWSPNRTSSDSQKS